MDNNILDQDLKYQKAIVLLDRLFVLKLIPKYDNINFKEIAKSTLLTSSESKDCNSLIWYIDDLSKIKLKYIDTFQQGKHPLIFYRYHLNELGIKVLEAGGHFAYIETLKAKELADHKRQNEKDAFAELDLKIKSWTYKARNRPYIFSTLALFGTSISIIISIKALNSKTDKSDLQQMQQKIQELTNHVKSQDSLLRVDNLLKKHK